MHFHADSFRFVQPTKLVLILCVLSVLCVNISAQDWKTVADGVEYAEVRREFSGKPVNINLLRLDLTKVRLDVHHAMDMAIGTEKTSSIATRHGAFAAINAGFFRLDTSIWVGDSEGVLAVDNSLYSESFKGRVALFLNVRGERTEVYIERANISNRISIKGKDYDVGTNRARTENDLVVYTNVFHRSTLTDNSGVEFVVINRRIKQVLDKVGSALIPYNGYIVSASGKMRDELLKLVKTGMKIDLTSGHSSPTEMIPGRGYGQSSDVVGGVPQLIKNGKIDITWEQEKASKSFVETPHPRTAVAKLKDGKFLMLTVDGRSDESAGLDLYDLAKYMLELGAVDAMNLDGGGSTTMFLDGKVVNKPSEKGGERKVGDAILVTLRKPKRK